MSRRPARCTEADLKRAIRAGRYPGHVYFFRAEKAEAVKIGYSKNPQERLANLNTGSPEPLHWIASIPGCRGDEAALHKKFKHLRQGGEWFRDCDELNNHIEDLLEDYEEISAYISDINGFPP